MCTSIPPVSKLSYNDSGRCEALVGELTAMHRQPRHKQADGSARCFGVGRFRIGEAHYCHRHAGKVLLEWHLARTP